MIKANDLRIGNLVYHPKTDRNIVVEYHHIRFAVLYPDNGYEPIPITPEILIAAGFEKQGHSNEFWNIWRLQNEWWVGESLHDEPSAGVEKGYCYWGDDYVKVLFFHQLQNLYFALTGKELEIKLLTPAAP